MLNYVCESEGKLSNQFDMKDLSLFSNTEVDDVDADHREKDKTHITVCDINHSMLRVGSEKAKQKDFGPSI